MKLINSSAELVREYNPLKKIEMAGRTCYKSEKNITDESAYNFVKSLIDNKHYAMLEHAVFTFIMEPDVLKDTMQYPYFIIDTASPNEIAVTTNLRAIHENKHLVSSVCKTVIYNEYPEIAELFDWKMGVNMDARMIDPDTLPDVIRHRHKHMTLRFICDRGVTHELVRHRPVSFAQESTRYCNYAKKSNVDPEAWKAYEEAMQEYETYLKDVEEQQSQGNLVTEMSKPVRPTADLSFIVPAEYAKWTQEQQKLLEASFARAEEDYTRAIELGLQPQQARALLPNAIKTEIVVTASMTEWSHIMNLRYHGTTGKPHPDMKELMTSAFPIYRSQL